MYCTSFLLVSSMWFTITVILKLQYKSRNALYLPSDPDMFCKLFSLVELLASKCNTIIIINSLLRNYNAYKYITIVIIHRHTTFTCIQTNKNFLFISPCFGYCFIVISNLMFPIFYSYSLGYIWEYVFIRSFTRFPAAVIFVREFPFLIFPAALH